MSGQRLFQISVREKDGGWLLTDIVAAPSRRKAARQILAMYREQRERLLAWVGMTCPEDRSFGPQDIGVRPMRAPVEQEAVA